MAEAAAPEMTSQPSGAEAAAAEMAAGSPTPVLAVATPSAEAGAQGGDSDWTRQVTCRFFMHGICEEGDNCRYSHDLSDRPPRVLCKYFQRGYCIYRDCCRYEHCEPLKQEAAAATDRNANSSLAAVSSLSSVFGPTAEANPGEAESRRSSLATAGAGWEDWVNAPEFVPGQPYRGRVAPSCAEAPLQTWVTSEDSQERPLCLYAAVGECRYGENCMDLHGDICELCGLQALHPTDAAQRSQHIQFCIETHEKNMEFSFAVQRSKDKVCGICKEVVYEKANPSECRFGILSNCNHVYCLKCIRMWRSAGEFTNKIIKSCPECRITSDFVVASEHWVEEREEKQQLIQQYKEAMNNKACRYFDEGRGSCPFAGYCFYKHAYPDGRREEPQ